MYRVVYENLETGFKVERVGDRAMIIVGPSSFDGAVVIDSVAGDKLLSWNEVVEQAQKPELDHENEQTLFESVGMSEDGTPAVCLVCGRERLQEESGYDALKLLLKKPQNPGWYSGDDGEICGEDMLKLFVKSNG